MSFDPAKSKPAADAQAAFEKRKEERSQVIQMGREALKGIATPGGLLSYLAFASRQASRFSEANVRLIYAQRPDALLLRPYDAWKQDGYPVRRQEEGVRLYLPVFTTTLTLPDGKEIPLIQATESQREAFEAGKIPGKKEVKTRISKMFDIRQTDAPKEAFRHLICPLPAEEETGVLLQGLVDYAEEDLGIPVTLSGKEEGTPSTEKALSLSWDMPEREALISFAAGLGKALAFRAEGAKSLSGSSLAFAGDMTGVLIAGYFGRNVSSDPEMLKKFSGYFFGLFPYLPGAAEKEDGKAFEKLLRFSYSAFKEELPRIRRRLAEYLPDLYAAPGKLQDLKPEMAEQTVRAAAREEAPWNGKSLSR